MSAISSGRFRLPIAKNDKTKSLANGRKKLRFAETRNQRFDEPLGSTQSEQEDVSMQSMSEKTSGDFMNDEGMDSFSSIETGGNSLNHSSGSLSIPKDRSSLFKESMTRKWVNELDGILSELNEEDEEDEQRPESANEKLSDEFIARIQKTIESLDNERHNIKDAAYYASQLREITFTNNGPQLQEIVGRGGVSAIVAAMDRYSTEEKRSSIKGKKDDNEENDDLSSFLLRFDQLATGCLANVARQTTLCAHVESTGGLRAILAAMKRYPHNPNLQEKGLCCICYFARSQQFRRALLENYDIIKVIVFAMVQNKDIHVRRRALVALHRFSVPGSDNCLLIGNSGGIEAVLMSMSAHRKDARVQMLGCAVLKTLCRMVEQNKTLLVSEGGLSIVLQAMKGHEADPGVQVEGCRLFGHLSTCHVERKFSIARSGALDIIIKAMKKHPKVPKLQIAACVALLNLTEKLQIAQMANALGALKTVRGAKAHCPNHARKIIARLRLARYAPIVWMS